MPLELLTRSKQSRFVLKPLSGAYHGLSWISVGRYDYGIESSKTIGKVVRLATRTAPVQDCIQMHHMIDRFAALPCGFVGS